MVIIEDLIVNINELYKLVYHITLTQMQLLYCLMYM